MTHDTCKQRLEEYANRYPDRKRELVLSFRDLDQIKEDAETARRMIGIAETVQYDDIARSWGLIE